MNTTEKTLTITLTYGKGYTGKTGNKAWVARINGTDDKMGLDREFLDAESVEREHFNRPRTMINLTWELECGLYERSEHGERKIFMVYPHKDGHAAKCSVSDDRLKAMLVLMDEGMTGEEARKATKPVTATATHYIAPPAMVLL